MSEVQKPVEEPVVAPVETPATEPAPAVEETPAETTITEAPAPAAEQTTEETPVPAKEEVKPVEEGVLGYKAPGLIKSFIFSKKFFWFGTEPVEVKHLSSYLRGEKPEVANHNAAWSSHTGKGLLFFSKKASEKTSPAGVINLSEASDITNEGPVDFFFTLGGSKHTFQAASLADRDNWVTVLKAKIAEAKELAESVTGSETYKKSHSSLSKPLVAAVATPKKSIEVKKEEKAEIKEEKKEEKAEAKEEKEARKSRSASRKRNSIFGAIGFGKKEETPAAAVTKEAAAPAEVAPLETPAPVETTAPVETLAPIETPAPVAAEATEVTPALVEETPAPKVETKPAASKRNSIFGSLQSKFAPKEKKTEEVAPAVPSKDAEPVSETAPVIPAVEATEPLANTDAPPAAAPIEAAAPATNGEVAAAAAPAVKSEKRKSSIPWLNKKEKTTASDEEGEKPKSPFAKLRATVKGKKAEKVAEKPAEEPVEAVEAPATSEPIATEPVVSEPIPAAHASTPQVSATA